MEEMEADDNFSDEAFDAQSTTTSYVTRSVTAPEHLGRHADMTTV